MRAWETALTAYPSSVGTQSTCASRQQNLQGMEKCGLTDSSILDSQSLFRIYEDKGEED